MASAYKCDICDELFEKTERIRDQRIKLTIAVARYTNVKIDICEKCYDHLTKYIGMKEKAYWPEAKTELVTSSDGEEDDDE